MAIICAVNGGSPALMALVLAMILAGGYSFFSPMRIKAIDAIQSNAA